MRRVVFLILFCVLSGGCSLEKRRLADDVESLMKQTINIPIYLDVKGSFRKINHIPSNKDCHVFLIDENRKPIFVGNPLMSPELEKLFWRVLMGKTEE